jgi:RHS repeat-associated protein
VLGNGLAQKYVYYPWSIQGGGLHVIATGKGAWDDAGLAYSDGRQRLAYSYDEAGNITRIANTAANPDETQTYEYDALNRLASWTLGEQTKAYHYSSAGNLSWKEGVQLAYEAASPSGCQGAGGGHSIPHAVSSTASGNRYGYDCNGNTLAPGASAGVTWRRIASGSLADDYSLEYDAENRLVSVSGPNGFEASFVYNGDGQRVRSTIAGVTTTFVGNYYEVSGGVVTKYYYAGSVRVAVRTGANLYYLLADHLGSTSLTTDASGNKVAELRYTPWGETRDADEQTPTAYRYTGQREEASIGLYFYNARWVDPELGRFSQADTVVPSRGHPLNLYLIADYHEDYFLYQLNQYYTHHSNRPRKDLSAVENHGPANEQTFDRYAYSQNNPLRYVDLSGHCIWDLCIIEIGFASIGIAEIAAAAGVLTLAAYTYGPEGQQRVESLANTMVTWGEETAESLSTLMKGEYVPPGLNTAQRNAYREAVHLYKGEHHPQGNVPEDILDQIADSIKDGASPLEAVDQAPAPPEQDEEYEE